MIFANWKLNPNSKKDALKMARYSDYKGVVVCPPFVYIELVKSILNNADIGAQNCYYKEKGAYTGEVSADMVKSVGCKYVILGHSERREHLKETSSTINEKIKVVLEKNIIPVVCVGEKEKIDAIGQIKRQIKETLSLVPLEKVIIAYEPVFAIGTGDFCPINLAKERLHLVKDILSSISKTNIIPKIIYGGSVNSNNAFSYINDSGFDGVLVGTAALDEDDFPKLVKSVMKS